MGLCCCANFGSRGNEGWAGVQQSLLPSYSASRWSVCRGYGVLLYAVGKLNIRLGCATGPGDVTEKSAPLCQDSCRVSTPKLVQAFYERIWNKGDCGAVPELLAEGFAFRGSLGSELRGREAFVHYVRSVRGSLSNYRCEILDCVSEGDQAFARMRFCGLHTGPFRGYAPTGRLVSWDGAALFRFEGGVIA